VNDDLPAKGKPHRKSVRVPVPGEKQQLENKDAHCPYGWRTTKKWKDFLAEQQLNLKEQKRTEEDRHGKRQLSSREAIRPHRGCTGDNDGVILPRHARNFDSDIHYSQSRRVVEEGPLALPYLCSKHHAQRVWQIGNYCRIRSA
jgi:hypothetical protein